MKSCLAGILVSVAALICLLPVEGGAPVKLSTVAADDDLVREAKAQFATLEGLLKDEKSYKEARKSEIPQAAGVIACLAQALAEHESNSPAKSSAPHLRDAAIAVRDAKSLDAARQGLARVKQALEGKAGGKAQVDYKWNKLINLHRLMEEVNVRNSKLLKVMRNRRRGRYSEEDSLHATTLAVLALATHADTHEVKDPANIKEWQGYSIDFQKGMTRLAAELKKKDAEYKKLRALHAAAGKSCAACHASFRDE